MKKMYLYIIVAMLILPNVFSISDDIWEVDYVKFYDSEGVRISGVDENGGDMELLAGDILEMRVNVENKHETHDMEIKNIKAWIKDIDDGDDLVEEDDNIVIDYDDSDIFKFEFKIPNDAEDDTYEVRLEIEAQLPNSTAIEIWREKWDLELVLEKRKQEFESYMLDIIGNVSEMCNSIDIEDKLSACIDKANLEGQVKSLAEQRDSYKADRDECLEAKRVMAEGCPTEKAKLVSDNENLKNDAERLNKDIGERDSQIVSLNNEIKSKETQLKKAESDKTTWGLVGIILGFLGYIGYLKWIKKSETPFDNVGKGGGGLW